MTRITILVFFTCILTQLPWAVAEPNQNPYSEFEPAQINEEWRAVRTNLHATLSFRAAVVQRMLEEANWVAGALKLPTRHPIQITDIQNAYILPPFSCILPGTNLLYDIRIPREQRLRALKFGPNGWIATTNFQFYFREGRLWQVMRLSRPNVEYLADSLDTLVSKPSLIDTNGAYQLATQWLAAVDMNMAAVSQLKWTVNQLHYKIRGATNYIALPLFYVDFGNKHHSANGNLPAFDEPLISVEVLGTSKELQNLIINDLSLSRRPLLIITNALDLIRTPNPPVKQLQNPATARAYALTPTEVSNYSKNFQPASTTNPPLKHLQRSNPTNSP